MVARVVVTDVNYPDLDIERAVFEDAGVEMVAIEADGPDDVIEAAGDADALLTQYIPVPEWVFDALPDLRVVGRYGVGVDTVDVAAASEHGVRVVNDPTYCLEEVATHAVAALLALHRRLPTYDATVAAGEWDWTAGRPIRRLSEMTVGLAAFGNVARCVADRLRPFGADVIAHDPYVATSAFRKRDVEPVGFEELCRRSDALSVHAPLTNETGGFSTRWPSRRRRHSRRLSTRPAAMSSTARRLPPRSMTAPSSARPWTSWLRNHRWTRL